MIFNILLEKMIQITPWQKKALTFGALQNQGIEFYKVLCSTYLSKILSI